MNASSQSAAQPESVLDLIVPVPPDGFAYCFTATRYKDVCPVWNVRPVRICKLNLGNAGFRLQARSDVFQNWIFANDKNINHVVYPASKTHKSNLSKQSGN